MSYKILDSPSYTAGPKNPRNSYWKRVPNLSTKCEEEASTSGLKDAIFDV